MLNHVLSKVKLPIFQTKNWASKPGPPGNEDKPMVGSGVLHWIAPGSCHKSGPSVHNESVGSAKPGGHKSFGIFYGALELQTSQDFPKRLTFPKTDARIVPAPSWWETSPASRPFALDYSLAPEPMWTPQLLCGPRWSRANDTTLRPHRPPSHESSPAPLGHAFPPRTDCCFGE